MTPIVSLRGRELERATLHLLAIAQVHRPAEERPVRAPAIAEGYVGAEAGELWGWEEDGEIVGLVGVEQRGDLLHVSELAVLAGRRRGGLGRSLLRFLREHYPDREIEGDTLEDLRGFYEACGFEVIATRRTLPTGEATLRFRLPPKPPSTSASSIAPP